MPSDPNLKFGFWYGPNHAPPATYAKWDELIRRFAEHLIERYGIEEVATWYFERLERAEYRLLGGYAAQADVLRLVLTVPAEALKAVDLTAKPAGRWAVDRASCLVVRHFSVGHVQEGRFCPVRFCLDARLCQ
jgi:xylan 1,4-beta-xylosidase